MASVLGYTTAKSQGNSNYFCFAVEGNVDSTATGSKKISGWIKVYFQGSYTPYYSWSHTVRLSINGTSVVNKTGNYPGSSGDWKSTSTTIGGRTYNRVYTAGSGTVTIPNTGGNITVSGSYSVSGSANYLPAAGTYTPSGTIYMTPSVWNGVNVYNPSGTQDYLSGYFDLYTSENGSWRYDLLNEDTDMTHLVGSYFQIQNIRPYYDYYELNSVSGQDSEPSAGAYRKTFDTEGECLNVYMRYKSYTLDLNGLLDGVYSGGLSPYGTANVTVNGSPSGNVSDYCAASPYNYSYSIDNIIANSGYQYNGLASDSAALSGTIGTGKNVRLNFTTIVPSSLAISRTGSATNSISVSVSASGLNISNYTVYYKTTSASSYSSLSLGTSTTGTISGLSADTNYNIYFSATNPGGTVNSGVNTWSTTLTSPSISTPVVSNLLPFTCTITATGSITPSRTLTYSFSNDNGSTWTAYQSANYYNWTGLSEETTYQMKVRVKATHVGNNASDTTTTSSALNVTTLADQAKIRKKINGIWKQGKTYIKKNGEWKKVKKVYKKKNGVWIENSNS